jgi:hypothetical protein
MSHEVDYVEMYRARLMRCNHVAELLAAYRARVQQMRADLARVRAIA